LRPDEVLAEQERLSLVFLPVGVIEWHGPHLPLGTDVLLAHEAALRLARDLGGVVHPPIFCGTERERRPEMLRDIGFSGEEWVVGMDFPANSMRSYYYPEETLGLLVRDALAQLVGHGYRLIVIVNGHGAENQIGTLRRLAAACTAQGQARAVVVLPFPIEHDEQGRETTSAGHADIFETSVLLHLRPECVDVSKLPPPDRPLRNTDWAVVDGATFSGSPTPDHTVRAEQDPRRASAEAGRAYAQSVHERLLAEVRAAIAGMSHKS
jgi:creatinine amidohydrolase